jgi:hypothetical protein
VMNSEYRALLAGGCFKIERVIPTNTGFSVTSLVASARSHARPAANQMSGALFRGNCGGATGDAFIPRPTDPLSEQSLGRSHQ